MKWYLKCLKQYADFSGRARRKEYWMFTLFNVIFSAVLTLLDILFGTFSYNLGLGVLSGLYALALLIPGIAACVRRLHDVGKSGWYWFLCIIPFVGAIILLIWECKEGEHGNNAWGENPKQIEY